jgi:tetratricopeptide (TPR) repeat protein
MADSKDRIVFLSVPESLRGRIESMTHHRDEDDGHDHADDEEDEDYDEDGHERHLHEEGEDHDDEGHVHHHEEFAIDPEIPIPVELALGEETLNLEELSWEMILSGMLQVVSTNIKPEWTAYYRRFVLTLRPDILSEFTEAAILKAKNGDFDAALEILAALRGLFPQFPPVLLNQALVLEEQAASLDQAGREEDAEKRYVAAEQAYGEVLALEPPFPNALFNAGHFYLKRRDYRRAKECFTSSLAVEGTVDLAALLDEEKKENAEFLLREIEEGGLDDESFQEAYNFIRQGNEEAGLASIRSFLERHPSVWNGWFILGWGLRRLERWEDALASFKKTLEMGGENSDTRNEAAICLMELEDFSAARKELETALRDDPDNIKIISNLGVLAMRQGDDDEAAAFFRIVQELEPEDPLAAQYFAGRNF